MWRSAVVHRFFSPLTLVSRLPSKGNMCLSYQHKTICNLPSRYHLDFHRKSKNLRAETYRYEASPIESSMVFIFNMTPERECSQFKQDGQGRRLHRKFNCSQSIAEYRIIWSQTCIPLCKRGKDLYYSWLYKQEPQWELGRLSQTTDDNVRFTFPKSGTTHAAQSSWENIYEIQE